MAEQVERKKGIVSVSGQHVLKACNLSKVYQNVTVVNDISLSVHTGKIVGLLGANGSGKTTSFYMLLGLIPKDAGEIYFDDKCISKLPIHQRSHLGIGYLPQEKSIFASLSVQDNIMAILELRKDLSNKEREQLLEDILEAFSIERIRHNKGGTLSGGECRRVEIARMLGMNPKFALFDEPFAAVDPISVSEIKTMIRRLVDDYGIGVLVTDHSVQEVLSVSDYVYVLAQGHMIAQGEPSEIIANPAVREKYLGENFLQ